jgi:hypothetical protein
MIYFMKISHIVMMRLNVALHTLIVMGMSLRMKQPTLRMLRMTSIGPEYKSINFNKMKTNKTYCEECDKHFISKMNTPEERYNIL